MGVLLWTSVIIVAWVSTPLDFSDYSGFGSRYSTGLLRLFWVWESVLHLTSPFILGLGVSTPLDFSVYSWFGSRYSTGLLRLLWFGSRYSTGLLRLFLVWESVLHWTSPFTLVWESVLHWTSPFILGLGVGTPLDFSVCPGLEVGTPLDFSVYSCCSPVFTMASEWKFNFRLFGPNVLLSFGPKRIRLNELILNGSSRFRNVERILD